MKYNHTRGRKVAKLYFKYGCMGSSKSAMSLITKHNYEKMGFHVWFIKPSTDTRDGVTIIRSRIGLEAEAEVITPEADIYKLFKEKYAGDRVIVISDECQFFTEAQIDQMRMIVDDFNIPVLNYGLKTDFTTHFFPASKRLMEIADSLTEVKTICYCGKKATVNARLIDGKVVKDGPQVLLGGNESYKAMCHKCWVKALEK